MAKRKSPKIKLIECYGKCLNLDIKLGLELQVLGRLATEIYGEDLSADICAGGEIEFRTLDDNGFIDSRSIIRIEDILERQRENK